MLKARDLALLAALGVSSLCAGVLAAEPKVLVSDVTDHTFRSEVVESERPVLIDFWATWCGPCRLFGPIVEQVAQDYHGRLKVCRVDVDQNPKLSRFFKVRNIPTAVLLKDGKVVNMWIGLRSGDELKAEIDKIFKKPKKRRLRGPPRFEGGEGPFPRQ